MGYAFAVEFFGQNRQPGLDSCAAGWRMFGGIPAAQLCGSFEHGHPTDSGMIGRCWKADAVVVDFDGEPIVHTTYADSDALRVGVFRCVAPGLLCDAVSRDLDRGRQHREFTSDLESNARRTLRAHHCAEFGVLLKGSQETPMIQGWWAESFNQAANVCKCSHLQGVQFL